MVNIIKRMRHLRELLWIRTGPGALILPKEVSKITMEFHKNIEGGHHGAKRFWRDTLPKIKYRNPSIPIQITRHSDPSGPATLSIFTKTPSTTPAATTTGTSSTPSTSTDHPAHTVDIKNMPSPEILAQLVSRTSAVELQPTEQEADELKEIEEFKKRSEADRVMVRERLLKEREEARLLKVARGEIA